jgi:hypothetical protein
LTIPDPIKSLLDWAQKNGYVNFDVEAAELYLANRSATGPEAKRIAQHFEKHVFTAPSFEDLVEESKQLDDDAPECPECVAYASRDAERLMVNVLVKDGKTEAEARQLVARIAARV